MKDKVVYLHKKAGTDEVVYVGIGSPSRPFDFIGRSDFWKKVHDKYGIDVEVIHTGLTIEQAAAIEVELIAKYGRRIKGKGTLVNLSAGGEHGNDWTRDPVTAEVESLTGEEKESIKTEYKRCPRQRRHPFWNRMSRKFGVSQATIHAVVKSKD